MLQYLLLLAGFGAVIIYGATMFTDKGPDSGSKSTTSIYDLSYTGIHGDTISLASYRGKKILFVNVASKCGFTPQYADLEKLYKTHKDKLVIIGFPANDFMGQEPGENEQIASFCSLNYGVTFPLAAKSHVIGDERNPVFKWLSDKSLNGWNDSQPKWNFTKYLVSEKGELVRVFPSSKNPMSSEIQDLLK